MRSVSIEIGRTTQQKTAGGQDLQPSNIFPDPITSKNTVEDPRGVLEQQQQDGHAEQAEVLAVEQPVHCHQRHGLQHGQHHLRGPARQPRHQGLRGNWHSVGLD